MLSDGTNAYAYDAEGNVTGVSGSTNAQYVYDALNQRVRITGSGDPNEFIFNAGGQRSLTFDPVNNYQYGKAYWGASPVSYYYGDGQTHFEYQDWQGTERMRTYWDGSVEATYQSLPWGDGFSASGADDDPYHFAGLDQDASSLDHAQYREYFNMAGRWMSPDPYGGSYDFANPQSFNRYAYVNGRPLSFTDPSGQFLNGALAPVAVEAGCGPVCWTGLVIEGAIGLLADLLVPPQFHGSLKPRPSAGGGPNWDGNFGESLGISTKIPQGSWGIATALGLPDAGCEFGVCGSVVFNATNDQGQQWGPTTWAISISGVWVWFPVPIVAGAGPAFNVTWAPSKRMLCGGLGLGAAAGHTIAGGLEVVHARRGQKIKDVLSSWSLGGGFNAHPLAGVQASGNLSGGALGWSVGVPGGSLALTYSGCHVFAGGSQ